MCAVHAAAGAKVLSQVLVNGSFEQRSVADARLAEAWAQEGAAGLALVSDHYEGAAGAMLVGDGKVRGWRQHVETPAERTFTLGAMVKAEGVSLGAREDFAFLYGHILYRGRPYSEATHFYARIPAGTYDWRRISVEGAAFREDAIEAVLVTVTGKLSAGRLFVDGVELTAARSLEAHVLMANKVSDLRKQLLRVCPVDGTVVKALEHLRIAEDAIEEIEHGGSVATVGVGGGDLPAGPELMPAGPTSRAAVTAESGEGKRARIAERMSVARVAWEAGAAELSHAAWAAMYPEAMPRGDGPEARMIYHGMAQTKPGCDAYMDVVTRTGCNGVYHSLGSWMGVIHHSKLLPIEPGWGDFDALAYQIGEARKRGVKSFAYIAALYGTLESVKETALYTAHPDWFAKGPDANMPVFPDPANPEVADFIVKVYAELAEKYDLDGIGLDYIRYPSPTALNYDGRNRDEILARFGFDILESEPWRDAGKWEKVRLYRAEKVGAIVKRVREAVKRVKPRMAVMACLISDPNEALDYGQRWEKSSEWIDYLSPMNYDKVSGDSGLLGVQRRVATAARARWIPAVGGMPDLHAQRTISEWAKMVAIQRDAGADGMIIYRMGGFDPAVGSFFGKGAFHGVVAFPEAMKK